MRTAVIVMTCDGRVVQWSKEATDIFGWSQDEAVGSLMPPIYSSKDPIRIARFHQRLTKICDEQKSLVGVLDQHYHKSGHVVQGRVFAFPFEVGGSKYAVGMVVPVHSAEGDQVADGDLAAVAKASLETAEELLDVVTHHIGLARAMLGIEDTPAEPSHN